MHSASKLLTAYVVACPCLRIREAADDTPATMAKDRMVVNCIMKVDGESPLKDRMNNLNDSGMLLKECRDACW